MPQKTRRQKVRAASRPFNVPVPPARPTATSAPTNAVELPAPRIATRASLAQPTFDYTYVYRDLRRIGLLAGSFFAALVALSYFLPK